MGGEMNIINVQKKLPSELHEFQIIEPNKRKDKLLFFKFIINVAGGQ
jgi:hypothetical protein